MIQKIYVYNYIEMQDKLVSLPYDAKIIGCIDTELVNTPLFETDDFKLLLQFDDCTPETKFGLNPQLMSSAQADQVVRYLLKLVEGRVRHDLHIHCVGGQARSTAIAKFAAWLANLERKDIKTNNPFRPNPYVEKMLDDAYRAFMRAGSVQ